MDKAMEQNQGKTEQRIYDSSQMKTFEGYW